MSEHISFIMRDWIWLCKSRVTFLKCFQTRDFILQGWWHTDTERYRILCVQKRRDAHSPVMLHDRLIVDRGLWRKNRNFSVFCNGKLTQSLKLQIRCELKLNEPIHYALTGSAVATVDVTLNRGSWHNRVRIRGHNFLQREKFYYLEKQSSIMSKGKLADTLTSADTAGTHASHLQRYLLFPSCDSLFK